MVLQLLVLLVNLIDFLLHRCCFFLGACHCKHAVRSENILKQQKRERAGKEPARVAAEKVAQLIGKTRCVLRLRFGHWTIDARVSSASF